MRWVKHMVATRRDERIALLIASHGMEGYGFYWAMVEIVAEAMGNGDICRATYPLTHWSHLLHSHHNRVSKYLGILGVTGLVTVESIGGNVTVTIPNLLKYRDEYSRKSGQPKDNVGSKNQSIDTEAETEKDISPNPPDPEAKSTSDLDAMKQSVGDAVVVEPEKTKPAMPEKFTVVGQRMHNRHPKGIRKDQTAKQVAEKLFENAKYRKVKPADYDRYLDAVGKKHATFCDSDQWQDPNFAKALSNYISKKDGAYHVELAAVDEEPARVSKSSSFANWKPNMTLQEEEAQAQAMIRKRDEERRRDKEARDRQTEARMKQQGGIDFVNTLPF